MGDSEAVARVREWARILDVPGRDLSKVPVWGGLTAANIVALLAERDQLHKGLDEVQATAVQYAREINALRATRGDDQTEHVIDLREDGWTIMHPLSCRPNLFDCPLTKAVTEQMPDWVGEFGRFPCRLDEAGNLLVSGEAP